MRGEGRMSSRRTSKCSPADLLEEQEGQTHRETQGWKHGRQQLESAQNAATHLLLAAELSGIETRIEVSVPEAPWWPSSLRDVRCNYATTQPTSPVSNLARDSGSVSGSLVASSPGVSCVRVPKMPRVSATSVATYTHLSLISALCMYIVLKADLTHTHTHTCECNKVLGVSRCVRDSCKK